MRPTKALLIVFLLVVTSCDKAKRKLPSTQPIAFGAVKATSQPGAKVSLFGLDDHASSVVVITDRPEINTWSTLKAGLTQFVDRLDERQRFDLVIFPGSQFDRLGHDEILINAGVQNKQRAFNFLDEISGGGIAESAPGLRAALLARPDVIYCVLSSSVTDPKEFEQTIDAVDSHHAVRINTILFNNQEGIRSEYEAGTVRWLQSIANKTGGVYKSVDEEVVFAELGRYEQERMRKSE